MGEAFPVSQPRQSPMMFSLLHGVLTMTSPMIALLLSSLLVLHHFHGCDTSLASWTQVTLPRWTLSHQVLIIMLITVAVTNPQLDVDSTSLP